MIGNPVAAQNFRAKTSAFVLRTKGCADAASVTVSGAAEGLIAGARRTVRLAHIGLMQAPDVHAVFREWPAEGVWVVNLTGRCGAATAAALVPVGPKGFIRELAQHFSRPATDAEVEASLKALAEREAQTSTAAK
jgi:hypothetical protein